MSLVQVRRTEEQYLKRQGVLSLSARLNRPVDVTDSKEWRLGAGETTPVAPVPEEVTRASDFSTPRLGSWYGPALNDLGSNDINFT